MSLDSLIERLENAKEGSRELDQAILDALYQQHGDAAYEWLLPDGNGAAIKPFPFSTSLDAALSLLPEGAGWAVYGFWMDNPPTQYSFSAKIETNDGRIVTGNFQATAPSPAHALCIAALKAREVDLG